MCSRSIGPASPATGTTTTPDRRPATMATTVSSVGDGLHGDRLAAGQSRRDRSGARREARPRRGLGTDAHRVGRVTVCSVERGQEGSGHADLIRSDGRGVAGQRGLATVPNDAVVADDHEPPRWPDARAEPPVRSTSADRDRAGRDGRDARVARRRRRRPSEVRSPRRRLPRVPVRPHGGQHRHRAPGVRRDPRPLRPRPAPTTASRSSSRRSSSAPRSGTCSTDRSPIGSAAVRSCAPG